MLSPLSLLAIEENEEVRLSSLKSKTSSLYTGQEDNYDCGFELSSKLPCPSEDRIESFKNRSYSLDSLGALETSSSRVTNKNQINWSSIDDCVRYWNVLSKDDQYALRCLILSDTVSNSNRYGVKKRNLESHLLLHIGVDMTNIVNNGYDSVLTNLMHPVTRRYSSVCLDSRTIDAKTCRIAHYNFTKTYSTSALFEAGYVAYQCVISSDESYRNIDADCGKTKKQYQEFFKSNNKELSRLSNKRALVHSYIYSNEISVDSILEGKYRPHTHVLFFIPREKSPALSEAGALKIEAVFNSRFNDRKMSLKRIERDDDEVPKVMKNNEECEKSVGYFYRAYSLADQYAREVRDDNIELLNHKTRECYRMLVWMFKPSDDQKSFRHVAHSRIPKQGETVKVPHLQNKRKSSTIKKAASLKSASENSQTMNNKDIIVKSAIFGMKRRRNERNEMEGALGEFRNAQGKIDPEAIAFYKEIKKNQQYEPNEERLSPSEMAGAVKDKREYEAAQAEKESKRQQELAATQRQQMAPGYRNAYQRPEAPRPAPLRGALSSNERDNDRIIQQQIAQNAQRGTAPVNARPATPEQAANAAAGKGYHTVDQNGAGRYVEGKQPQTQQNPYLQAQQSAMQQHPELSQADSPMNKAFLGLVNQNGGSAALQKDPSLISRYAQQAQQQLAQNKAPAASPAQPVAPQQAQPQLAQGNNSAPGAMPAQGTPGGPNPTQAPQAGNKNSVSPKMTVEQELDQLYANQEMDRMKYNTAQRPAGQAPRVDDSDFVGPRPSGAIQRKMLDDQEAADDAAFAANQKANKPPAAPVQANKPAPAPVQANNNQAQNPLLSGPAASNSFAGNVSLGLGGASKPLTPGQPVASTNPGAAPIKQGSMLSEFKDSVFEKRAEQDYLNYLREELLKEADLVYSKEEVEELTASRDNFEKAAELEAQLVWNGLLDQLKKEGASEDFVEGFTKEAGGLGNVWKGIKNFGTSSVIPTLKGLGFKKPSLGGAIKGLGVGGTLGGLTMGLPGAAALGLGGALTGGLGTGGATLATGAALHGLGAFGSNKKKLDPYGAPEDRHRAVPFAKNKYTGAAGGALLAHAIARENGLEGPMSWLLPIIGGMVGHKYFPEMMNKWKDPKGYGVNSVGSGAAMIHQPQNVYGG